MQQNYIITPFIWVFGKIINNLEVDYYVSTSRPVMNSQIHGDQKSIIADFVRVIAFIPS